MKFKLAAVTLFACVAMICSESNGQILDRMLDRGGCGCEATPSCCDTPASCGGESLCSKLKGGQSGRLLGGCGGGGGCGVCGDKAPVLTCGGKTGFDCGCGAGGGLLGNIFKPRGNGLLAVGTGASAFGAPTIDTCGPTCSAIEAAPDCGCSGGSGCGLASGSLFSKIRGGCTAGGCAGGASLFGKPATGSCGFGVPAGDAGGSCGCGAAGGGGCSLGSGSLFARLRGTGGGCGGAAPAAKPCGCSAPAPVAVSAPCGCSASAPVEPGGCGPTCGGEGPSCGGGLLKGLFGRIGSLGCGGGGDSGCGCGAPAPAPVAWSSPAPAPVAIESSCGCSAPAPAPTPCAFSAPAPVVVESAGGCGGGCGAAPAGDCGCGGGGLDLRGRVSNAVSNLRPAAGGCGSGCGALHQRETADAAVAVDYLAEAEDCYPAFAAATQNSL